MTDEPQRPTRGRRVVKRQLKESIPKHIQAIQEILLQIAIEYESGNELAQATSQMCYQGLEFTEILEQFIQEINNTI